MVTLVLVAKFGTLYGTPIKWFKTPSNFDRLSFISSDILLPEPVSLQVELLLLDPWHGGTDVHRCTDFEEAELYKAQTG